MTFTYGKKIALVLLVCFTLVSIVILYYWESEKGREANDQAAQIFTNTIENPTYTDLSGNSVLLEDYLGRLVVATTWASWSPFSAKDLVALNQLASSYDQNEVTFLAVNRKETLDRALRYLSTLPELPRLLLVIDQEDRFYSMVGGFAMPETVVFNQDGEIIVHERGELNVERVSLALTEALKSQ